MGRGPKRAKKNQKPAKAKRPARVEANAPVVATEAPIVDAAVAAAAETFQKLPKQMMLDVLESQGDDPGVRATKAALIERFESRLEELDDRTLVIEPNDGEGEDDFASIPPVAARSSAGRSSAGRSSNGRSSAGRSSNIQTSSAPVASAAVANGHSVTSEAPQPERPRSVRPAPAEPEKQLAPLAKSDRAPARASRQSSSSHSEERRGTKRVALEIEIGFYSVSNFYTGFSADLSDGGIFIATYDVLPIGTKITVSFTLPGGRDVSAQARVAWHRDAIGFDSELEPGMGVAFEAISAEDEAIVREFIEMREPLFYEA